MDLASKLTYFFFLRIQSIANNKFLVVLELDDVIETDAGLYKVKAKNKMGEVAASINLNFSREYYFTFTIFLYNLTLFFKCVQYVYRFSFFLCTYDGLWKWNLLIKYFVEPPSPKYLIKVEIKRNFSNIKHFILYSTFY